MTRRVLAAIIFGFAPLGAFSADCGAAHCEHANNDLGNIASLQRGARHFVNYCSGCHSAKYVRYNRLAHDLRLTEDQLMTNLMFAAEKPHETMTIAMPPADAERWFGVPPPDLSLIARARGTDYLYTFLKSYYLDDSTSTGVNNLVKTNVSMPHVLWELQGPQKAVYTGQADGQGNVTRVFEGFELLAPGELTPLEYDAFVRDLVNFLDYIGEPVQLERRNLGIWVLLFLLVFFFVAYLLKKEYWKDVH